MARAKKTAPAATPDLPTELPDVPVPVKPPKKRAGLRMLRLKVESFMRLIVADISPNGESIVVYGANDQGKTSLLTAIWAALGGAEAEPTDPVHDDAKEASIEVTLGQIDLPELIVRYRRAANTTDEDGKPVKGKRYLELLKPDGSKFPQAQTTLNELIGKLMFDPLAFMRMKPADQATTLAKVAGIDIKAHALFRKGLYEARAEANRKLKEADEAVRAAEQAAEKARLDARLPMMPANPIDVAESMAKIKEAQAKNKAIDDFKAECDRLDESCKALQVQADGDKKDVDRLKAELKTAEDNLAASLSDLAEEKATADQKKAEHAKMKKMPTDEFEADIKHADAHNAAYRSAKTIEDAKAKAKSAQIGADGADSRLTQCDEDFEKKLAASPIPVKGVTFTADEVLYQGRPLDQAAKSVQIRLSAEIAAASGSKCRIMNIYDGSLLDSNAKKILHEVAERHDVQLCIEEVSEEPQDGIRIVEGRVAP